MRGKTQNFISKRDEVSSDSPEWDFLLPLEFANPLETYWKKLTVFSGSRYHIRAWDLEVI